MKYLENAFKFLGKFYLLLIPLFIAVVIPAIIGGPSTNAMTAQLQELQNALLKDPTMIQDASDLFELLYGTLAPSFATSSIASLLSFILLLIVTPATYGMVNKALDTGKADLNDFAPEMKNNISKYIIFGLASIVLYFGIAVAAMIIIGIFIALSAISKPLGILLIILFSLALGVFIFAFSYLTLLWFPAMVSDGLGVFDALKKSISVVKSYFWPIVGISFLMMIGSAVAGSILGRFGSIAIIGPTLTSIVTVVVEFIMIVFAFEVYRDKTGKNGYRDEGVIPEIPGDYL